MLPLPFGPKKCSKQPTSRIPEKLVLFGQTASKGPLPLDLLVFGRKQAPDVYAPRVFGPKKLPRSILPSLSPFVTAMSPLAFGPKKSAQNGQLPDFPKTSFFSKIFRFRPSTAACRAPHPCPDNLPSLSPFFSPTLTRQPAKRPKRLPGLKILAILNQC